MIYKNLLELIGNTPLVKINNFNIPNNVEIIAKLEYFNPLGSVKDRIGFSMIEDAEKKGVLKKGMTIIESTSGNTGIALAFISAIKNYKCILVMPESMSIERRKIMKKFGAELILTPAEKGMQGAIDEVKMIVSKSPEKYFLPNQFKNPANPLIHEKTTAQEIWRDTDGEIDILVAGIGTGGTITGIGRVLKNLKPSIKIIGVEPENSPIITKGKKGPHKIQGIGAGFIPEVLNLNLLDEVITVTDEEAIETSKNIALNEGILAGFSSGAAMAAALKVARKSENYGKVIVVIFPDTGERYLN